MKNFLYLSIVIVCGLSYGCGPMGAVNRSTPTTAYGYEKQELITRSLFDSKDRTISEEDVHRLLNGRIKIPDTVRVAIFKYASTSINRYYANWWTDEEYLKTQQSFVDSLTREIESSQKVRKVIAVPSMLTTSSPTITELRETAVRLQADILVVYSVTSDIYYKYKLFKKNEAKAFATCETIMMDTRTGVIPHSSVVTKEKLVVKGSEDFNESETRKQAEREAILLTLTDSGRRISAFLEAN
jgi:hypothetical protein